LCGKSFEDEVYAIPAAGLGPLAIGHRSPGRAFFPAEQQPQRSELDVRKGRSGAGEELEAEMLGVPSDRGIDIIHHVADVDGRGRHAGLAALNPVSAHAATALQSSLALLHGMSLRSDIDMPADFETTAAPPIAGSMATEMPIRIGRRIRTIAIAHECFGAAEQAIRRGLSRRCSTRRRPEWRGARERRERATLSSWR